MNARMIERIMTDGSEVWDVEMWQGAYDQNHSIILSFVSFKKGQDFVNNLRLLMKHCTVEQLVEKESLLNQPHC